MRPPKEIISPATTGFGYCFLSLNRLFELCLPAVFCTWVPAPFPLVSFKEWLHIFYFSFYYCLRFISPRQMQYQGFGQQMSPFTLLNASKLFCVLHLYLGPVYICFIHVTFLSLLEHHTTKEMATLSERVDSY